MGTEQLDGSDRDRSEVHHDRVAFAGAVREADRKLALQTVMTRRSRRVRYPPGGGSMSADLRTETRPNGRSVSSACADTHRRITHVQPRQRVQKVASAASAKVIAVEVITDRYHFSPATGLA
jgi:hypothetical protein